MKDRSIATNESKHSHLSTERWLTSSLHDHQVPTVHTPISLCSQGPISNLLRILREICSVFSPSLFRYALTKIKETSGEESRLDFRHTWAKSSAHFTGAGRNSFAVRTVHQWVARTDKTPPHLTTAIYGHACLPVPVLDSSNKAEAPHDLQRQSTSTTGCS